MGLEKKLDTWQKPDPLYLNLRKLTRERERLQKQLTEVKNHLHAEKAGAWPCKSSVSRMEMHKKTLQSLIKEVEKEIKAIVKDNPALKQKLNYLTSIPGIGIITAVTLVGETNGFLHFTNRRQLISYAGYDVTEKESGTSVKGKPKISHKGNRHIRKAMHMPALAAIRCNPFHKEIFKRQVSKHGIKMKGIVAIQRKLLLLCFALWKRKENFTLSKYTTQENKQIEQPSQAALTELA